MGNLLQDHRTVAELASVGQVIEFADKISAFESLADIVQADLAALNPDKIPPGWRESAVVGNLQFGFADAKRRVPSVSGSLKATVSAVCQRCLEAFQLQLNVELNLLLLTSEQVVDGYDEFEVWELKEQTIQPQDIVEELLIMALPFSPMHDNTAECKALSSAATESDGGEELLRPFAALRAQMTQNEKDPQD